VHGHSAQIIRSCTYIQCRSKLLSLSFKCPLISENHGSKSRSQEVPIGTRLRSVRKPLPPPHPVLESDDSDKGLSTCNIHLAFNYCIYMNIRIFSPPA
jgi:hypothetical protein